MSDRTNIPVALQIDWRTCHMSAIICLAMLLSPFDIMAQAMPTEVKRTEAGWSLLRSGKPYTVKGVGGSEYLELLAKSGGNSIRTWGVDKTTKELLDKAHELGLTVTLGIWLGHERHGFNYNDVDQVAKQLQKVQEAVLTYKDHPALLAWGIGNEMEGYEQGDNAAIWSHIEACAALVKRLDPNHPTMTVIAEIGGRKVESIHLLCPSIDIVGVNSYGGVASLPRRYKEAGGTKPYIVTEFGPPGTWEVKPNAFGAPVELSSTKKAAIYKKAYQTLASDQNMCLGSYAFLWGNKVETTTTWFGMFLSDGSKLAAVDAMTEVWSGKPPQDRCPEIISLDIAGEYEAKPGSEVRITLATQDPEKQSVSVTWTLLSESELYITGGDKMKNPPSWPKAILSHDETGCTVRLPEQPGIYRLYAVVKDSEGHAAVANVPLSAGKAPEGVAGPGKETEIPFAIYEDGSEELPWAPSGYMGNTKAMKVDLAWEENSYAGKNCIKVKYQANDQWAGVVWQDPVNDWGDRPGGYDLSGAAALEFWARGERGGEVIDFGFGLLGNDKKFSDTSKGELKSIRLTEDWRRYRIELPRDADMKRIKTGFYWSLAGQGQPVTFYLDNIRFTDQKQD